MTDENNSPSPAATGEESTPSAQFATQRIFVKDMSFESPNALSINFTGQPKVNQDLNTVVNGLREDLFEVVLSVTVTVKNHEDKTAFLAEVQQAGLFRVSGLETMQLQHLLSSQCPQILFPYAREAIDNMAVRGGFPPLMLPPINFEALYHQAMVEAQNRAEGEASTESAH